MSNQNTGVIEEDDVLNASEIDASGSNGVKPANAANPQSKKGRSRKALPLIIIVLILVVGVLSVAFVTGSRPKPNTVNVAAAEQQRKAVETQESADRNISEFSQQLRTNAPVVQTSPESSSPVTSQSPVTQTTQLTGSQTDVGNMPVTSTTQPNQTTVPNVAGTVESAPVAGNQTAQHTAPTSTSRTSAPLQPVTDSAPATQTSHYFFREAPQVSSENRERSRSASEREGNEVVGNQATSRVAVPATPPFDTNLRIRTLGNIQTLRPDAYVRLETVLPAKGQGWSLPRGTKFIGRVAGAENDRAYINIIGYIDPASGHLVKVGGTVNGVDGGSGLQGTHRHIGNRWVKALQQIGSSGIQTFNSWLAGRNGGTNIYVPQQNVPGMGGQSNQPITEYVEVKADTKGTIIITDLPDSVQGAQASSALGDSTTSAGSISDEEMIELMTTGTPEQIRAALPRMSPEMRRIAEAAINER